MSSQCISVEMESFHQDHDPCDGMCCRHASELNHSCCPNVTYHFEHHRGLAGPQIALRSTKAIAPGEAQSISYVNVLAPVLERLGSLQARYKFDCTCDRCQQEMRDQQPTPAGALLSATPGESVQGIMQAISLGSAILARRYSAIASSMPMRYKMQMCTVSFCDALAHTLLVLWWYSEVALCCGLESVVHSTQDVMSSGQHCISPWAFAIQQTLASPAGD